MSRKELIEALRAALATECPIVNRRTSIIVVMPDSHWAQFLCESLYHLRRVYSVTRKNIVRIPLDESDTTIKTH